MRLWDGSFGFDPLITYRSEKRSITYQSANYRRRGVSKSTPVCNCHNEDDIVAARQLSGENVAATDDYKYGSFREVRCNCRLSYNVDCGMYRVSVYLESRGAAWSPCSPIFHNSRNYDGDSETAESRWFAYKNCELSFQKFTLRTVVSIKMFSKGIYKG